MSAKVHESDMMGLRKAVLAALCTLLLALSVEVLTRTDAEQEALFFYDLEADGGSFLHGGVGDSWEWGIPGPGAPDNPGPANTAANSKCWGSPLNGTYQNGTGSFLVLPEFDGSGFSEITLGFDMWYDLSYISPDERNGSGEPHEGDKCYLEVGSSGGGWSILEEYSGSTEGLWMVEELSFEAPLGGSSSIRFRLVDNGDGWQDNGFFIDNIAAIGEPVPAGKSSFVGEVFVSENTAVDVDSLIVFSVKRESVSTLEEVDVGITITGPSNETVLSRTLSIGAAPLVTKEMSWNPPLPGVHSVKFDLLQAGELVQSIGMISKAYDTAFHDDASSGLNGYMVNVLEGNGSWQTFVPVGTTLTSSGGYVFAFSPDPGLPEGPIGRNHAYIETDWFDLSMYSEALLFLYQNFSFLGAGPAAGGSVEALDDAGSWRDVRPSEHDNRFVKIGEDSGGALGGHAGFVGSSDWYQAVMDLSPFCGNRTKLRFSVSSGSMAENATWRIDDIMVAGTDRPPIDMEPPGRITNVNVDILDEGAVVISWDPSLAKDLEGYNLYLYRYPITEVSGLPYTQVGPDTVELTLFDLDPSVRYWVGVTGFDSSLNEDLQVQAVSFIPSTEASNKGPIAVIDVIGGTTREVGEDFKFDGSGSYDPEGRPLTYLWRMPDGSIGRGRTFTWRSDRAGFGLRVSLDVKDPEGLTGSANVTVDVLEGEDGDESGQDLENFLLCLLPVLLIVLLVILLVVILRMLRRKGIERRLERLGITTTVRPGPQKEQEPVRPAPVVSKVQAKVLDLIPLHRKEEAPPVPKPPHPPKEPKRPSKGHGLQLKERKLDRPHGRKVNVTLECPFCGEPFVQKVDVYLIASSQPVTVYCPHCGKSGKTGG